MNGVHDMGGMDGFGKVEPELNEPMFYTEWEGRVLAMVRAMGAAGAFNIDTSRYYREALPPEVYMTSSYYRKWFIGLKDMLVAKGYISPEEVAAAHALEPGKPLKHGKFTADQVERIMVRGKFGRPPSTPAKFKPGDRVRAKNIHPTTHTRLPRMCVAMSAWSNSISVAASIPTRRRTRPVRTRNGSTPSCSTAPSCGGPMPIRR
jgi:nitrile hydratase subunit beta